MPFTLWVFRSIITLFHTLNHSGWWFMASATSATRVILPKAATKSLHANSRCNFPFTTLHPLALGSSAVISASESFLAGMAHPPESAEILHCYYAAQAITPQEFRPRWRAPPAVRTLAAVL